MVIQVERPPGHDSKGDGRIGNVVKGELTMMSRCVCVCCNGRTLQLMESSSVGAVLGREEVYMRDK